MRAMTSRRAFVAGAVAAVACGRRRATGFPGYAFVVNQGGRSVAAVDLTRFRVARQIRLERAPAAVAAHLPRGTVYVLAPEGGTIFEIGAADLAVKRKLSLGGTAVAMRMSPDGGSLWVLCQAPHGLAKVALDRFVVASRLKLPAPPEDFDLTRDGLLAAAVFPEARSIALLDLVKNRVVRIVAAGDDARAVRFRSDGRQLIVANRSARLLTVLDVKSGETLVRLPLPVEPENFCVKADGGEVYIAGKGMDAVVVVDPYHTQVTETLLAGKAPGALALSVSPEYLFAANPESGDVTVLDVETRSLVAAVKVGQEPCYITFTPDNQYALVVNHRSGDLAVIRLPITHRRSMTAPLFTMIPVGAEPVSAAVV
jgi:YVTN family beta-propeller protein